MKMRKRCKKQGMILLLLILVISGCGLRAQTTEPAGPGELPENVNVETTGSEELKAELESEESKVVEETELTPQEPSKPQVLETVTADAIDLDAEQPEPKEIRLVMVGDMLMHERVMESGRQENGNYCFDHLFTHVEDEIQEADLALVNQETILGGVELGLTGYPCFNSPHELGVAEVLAGFDVILFGTNHALDKGKNGVLNCMDFWDKYYPHIPYLGINRTQEEQDDEIYVYEQDGIRIAILNYTYGTNGIKPPVDMPYLVNYLEEDKVQADLAKAEEIADFTVVCPHWGTEYLLETSWEQERWTEIFLQSGADLVIGTHPHVIEPIEWITDDAGNEMLVYYSIGNFVNGTSGTGRGVMNRMVGGLADVTIGRDEEDRVVVKEYDVHPLVCHIGTGEEYTVWYLEDYTEELAAENHICSQDPDFSLENCRALVEKVWGHTD